MLSRRFNPLLIISRSLSERIRPYGFAVSSVAFRMLREGKQSSAMKNPSMTINEFNQQVITTEDGNNVYFDLRFFAERQSEAMDAYLSAAVTQFQAGAS